MEIKEKINKEFYEIVKPFINDTLEILEPVKKYIYDGNEITDFGICMLSIVSIAICKGLCNVKDKTKII